MPRRRRDLTPVPPVAKGQPTPVVPPNLGGLSPVETVEQQLLGLVQALRTNSELREAVAQLAQRPEAVPTIRGALSLLNAAERAGDDAPFGKRFDALHGVGGPQLLREISETVAQRAAVKHEAQAPEKKGALLLLNAGNGMVSRVSPVVVDIL